MRIPVEVALCFTKKIALIFFRRARYFVRNLSAGKPRDYLKKYLDRFGCFPIQFFFAILIKNSAQKAIEEQ